jgi:pimeloyl-ACP methyl ester carboxylesterase
VVIERSAHSFALAARPGKDGGMNRKPYSQILDRVARDHMAPNTDLAPRILARIQKVLSPTLIIHSREDASIPFQHAEWSLEHIPNARLCESGFTGHFYWIGPDYQRICESMIDFLQANVVQTGQILP